MSYPIGQISLESRLLSNLVAVHALVLLWLTLSIGLRWLLTRGANRLACCSDSEVLRRLSQQANKNGQAMLFWLTLLAMALTIAGALIYHYLGFDARHHINDWSSELRHEHFVRLGMVAGSIVLVLLLTSAVVRVIHRLMPMAEKYVFATLGSEKTETTVRQWFILFQLTLVVGARLAGLIVATDLLGLGRWTNAWFWMFVCLVSVVAAARLLSLAWRAISHLVADYGNRQLGDSVLHHYWERITRLLPLGERCFDAAVYVAAATLWAYLFGKMMPIAYFGEHVVECIGIFFGTRVAIELLQVLLNQALGMYHEEHLIDQKARTLLPLLHSVSQYALYFGSVVAMLRVLGVDTTPIMAGAGILGLGVGLGAQSLVTDVVSGFFILFENQFLVGDYVKIDDAAGTVEDISIRVTKVRDGQGKLHIIPNGQIKGVVSYSKGYVNAVVDVKLPAGGDLEGLIRAMTEAGKRIKAQRREVLAETEIHGVVEWSGADMTIRAVTRVEPAAHGIIQNEYRRILKQVLDEKPAAAVKPALAA